LHSEQLRRVQLQADKLQLENEITRGQYLPKTELMAGLSQLVTAILSVIEHSKLSREEKNDIRYNLSGCNHVLEDVGHRQTAWREADRNGASSQSVESKPKRSPKKVKKVVSGVGGPG
jgi:hypothetical protein